MPSLLQLLSLSSLAHDPCRCTAAKNAPTSPSTTPPDVLVNNSMSLRPEPTGPVQIPRRHHVKQSSHRRRMHDVKPEVAALLAVTDIPRRKKLDDVSEKELSLSLARSPMELLLSPPDDDDDMVSVLARTNSADSVPSLTEESFITDLSLQTPPLRRRRSPMRKSLEPVRSPPDSIDEHPLAATDLDDLEEEVLEEQESPMAPLLESFKPLRSVFKSNLTASLRALRSAAKSFSSINFSMPSDDFLTRSLLTIDPNVPYTDERRPPVSEDIPSAELRRYLNPTTSSRIDPSANQTRRAASIQMQTYRVQRSRSTPPPEQSPRRPLPHTSASWTPGMRQREMRENSDFIRIAVMEMAMRRRGKLDSQKPGRARWALPPRQPALKTYDVGTNGVPTRWVPETQ